MNFTNINAFYLVQGQKLHFGFTVTHLKKVWLTISRWRSLKFHISLATKRRKNPVVKSRTKFSPRHAIAEKKKQTKAIFNLECKRIVVPVESINT